MEEALGRAQLQELRPNVYIMNGIQQSISDTSKEINFRRGLLLEVIKPQLNHSHNREF